MAIGRSAATSPGRRKRLNLRSCCLMLLALVMGTILPAASRAESFKIIVNQSNPASEMRREEVAKAFLKKIVKWEKGDLPIKPVDLAEGSQIRENFSQMILDKRVAAVKAYWQNRIFSGRGVPPPEKETEKKVLEYVQDNPGAIGYISQDTDIEAYTVKVVRISGD